MKKALLVVPIFIVLLVGLMAAIGFALPKEYEVQRTARIDAPPEEVWAMVSDLKQWPTWVYWNEDHVADLSISYGDITQGEGASQSWSSKQGDGRLTFTECKENESIKFEMQFGEFPPMYSSITLKRRPVLKTDPATKKLVKHDYTEMTWDADGNMPNDPMSGWFGLLMRPNIGRDYDYGLAQLQEKLRPVGDEPEEDADEPSDETTT